MSNRIIAHVGKMLRDPNVTLLDVRQFLAPTDTPVKIEAWNMAKRQRRTAAKAQPDPPQPKRARVERERKIYRAERRNKRWGRNPTGNTTPAMRRANLASTA